MRAHLPATLLLAGWGLACAGADAQGPAARCAEVVGVARGLQGAVAVVGQPLTTSEGSVEIAYEGTDDMNVPVKGSASCTFAVGEDGALSLLEAVVDGAPLEADEIASIRRRLAARP